MDRHLLRGRGRRSSSGASDVDAPELLYRWVLWTGRTGEPSGSAVRVDQDFGQAASILSRVSFVLWPVIQAVACFQKASDPIAAGIWSDPSKRKTVFGSWKRVAASLSI